MTAVKSRKGKDIEYGETQRNKSHNLEKVSKADFAIWPAKATTPTGPVKASSMAGSAKARVTSR